MSPFIICYIVIYFIFLFFYFFSRTNGNFKAHAINKIILSSSFLLIGFLTYFTNYNLNNYKFIGLISIFFAFLADIIFLFDFSKGGVVFMISNIGFFLYELLIIKNYNIPFVNIYWAIPIFVILYGTILTLILLNKIKLDKYKIPFSIYLLTVTLHGILGLPLITYFLNTTIMLLPIGLLLFMISDYLILVYKFIFNNNKWVIRANSATYFIGLLLVSLSFL